MAGMSDLEALLRKISSDKNLMKQLEKDLGIAKPTKAKTTHADAAHPDYIHRVWGKCDICGTPFELMTLMTWSPHVKAYVRTRSIEAGTDVTQYKVDSYHYNWDSCEHCHDFLMSLEKEAIVKLFLQFACKLPRSYRRPPSLQGDLNNPPTSEFNRFADGSSVTERIKDAEDGKPNLYHLKS